MKSLIFNLRVILFILVATLSLSLRAQQSTMQQLIDQTLSQLQQGTPEAFLQGIAQLKRVDAMYPDSVQPKYHMTLLSLSYAVTNPQSPQTEPLLTESAQTIDRLAQMPAMDLSDLCTLRGFLYMVRIVQNPAQNGQRYYIDVMQSYEKALALNPDNQLAKQLQAQFFEGMKKQ